MSTTAAAATIVASPNTTLRILMLHGYTQSGDLFRAKVRALEKNFTKTFPQGAEFVYPTAPLRLRTADIPTFDSAPSTSLGGGEEEETEQTNSWGWWVKQPQAIPDPKKDVLCHLDFALDAIAQVLKTQGPFDGIIGFSQGAAMAAMVASLLEPGRDKAFASIAAPKSDASDELPPLRYPESFYASSDSNTASESSRSLIHPPLKFVVAYSGFRVLPPYYSPFYEPRIQTPLMSVLGSNDTVVDEDRSLALASSCERGEDPDRLLYHPGGHFVPSSQRQVVIPVLSFVKAHL